MSRFVYLSSFWIILLSVPAISLAMIGYQLSENKNQVKLLAWQNNADAMKNALLDLQTDWAELSTRHDDLQASYDRLEAQNRREKQLLQIAEQTRQALVSSMADNDQVLKNLKEELEIYRKVVAGAGEQAIRIYDWQVDPLEDEGHYRYKLVLVRAMEGKKKIRGEVRIVLEGLEGDKTTLIPITDLGAPKGKIGFKHFQTFEGDFKVPAEFMPIRVQVGVVFAGDKDAELVKWYFWHNV